MARLLGKGNKPGRVWMAANVAKDVTATDTRQAKTEEQKAITEAVKRAADEIRALLDPVTEKHTLACYKMARGFDGARRCSGAETRGVDRLAQGRRCRRRASSATTSYQQHNRGGAISNGPAKGKCREQRGR